MLLQSYMPAPVKSACLLAVGWHTLGIMLALGFWGGNGAYSSERGTSAQKSGKSASSDYSPETQVPSVSASRHLEGITRASKGRKSILPPLGRSTRSISYVVVAPRGLLWLSCGCCVFPDFDINFFFVLYRCVCLSSLSLSLSVSLVI
uniref:Uncharacterized protein n=1 Tax=Anopheles darlingi TaxID=43151 RepID=A0A2M4DC43_ANODA